MDSNKWGNDNLRNANKESHVLPSGTLCNNLITKATIYGF